MEALIHHFKLVTEGFRVPPGEAYYPIEGPRGELGCFVRADGSAKPARVHMRDPSFVNLQALGADGPGRLHRRPDRDARDARSDPRRDRPMSIGDGSSRQRSGALRRPTGSRVPRFPGRLGWRRRREAAGDGPGPGDDARPGRSARDDRQGDGEVPRPPLGGDPGAPRRPALHGWCSPEAIDAGRGGDAADAGLPDLGRDVLRHVRDRAQAASTTCTSARTSPARCAAPTSSSRR